jgi:tripartite-type tricarboxylate transporter receptor subunit TctC
MAQRHTLLLVLAVVVSCVFGIGPASAQGYPVQAVRIVVPFGPGSITDILARLIPALIRNP